MKKNRKTIEKIAIIFLFFIIAFLDSYFNFEKQIPADNTINTNTSYEISNIPEYTGQVYVEINNNNPNFTNDDMNLEDDYYSTLKDGKVRNGNGKNMLGKG